MTSVDAPLQACLGSTRPYEQASGHVSGVLIECESEVVRAVPLVRPYAGVGSNRSTGTLPWSDRDRAHYRRTHLGSDEPSTLRRRRMTVSTRIGRGLAA